MRGFFLLLISLFFICSISVSQTEAEGQSGKVVNQLSQIQNWLFEEKLNLAENEIDKLRLAYPADKNVQTRLDLLSSDLHRKRGEIEQARNLLRKTDPETIDNKVIKSEFYYHKSKVAEGNKAAIGFITKAISLRKSDTGTSFVSLSYYYNSAGIYQLGARHYDSSIYYYQKAITYTLNGEKPNYNDLALFYQNLALPYAAKKEYETSKALLLKSTTILKASQTKTAQNDLARNFNNLGRIYFQTGLMDSAEYYYNKSEKLRAKLYGTNKKGLAILYLNLGAFYSTISNFEKAETYYKKSKNIYEKLGLKESKNYYRTNLNLGFNYLQTKEYDNAISYLDKVIGCPFPELNGQAHRHLAKCHFNLDNSKKANELYLKSIKILNPLDNPYQLGLSYSTYGEFLISENKPAEARGHLHKAKDIFGKLFGANHRDIALTVLKLAKADLKENKFEEALQKSQRVLNMLVPGYDEGDYTSYPGTEKLLNDGILTDAILQKGKIFYQKHLATNNIEDLKNAFEAYKKGLEIIETKRLTFEYQSNQLSLTQKAESDYDFMLNILTELYHKTSDQKYLSLLFNFMERSKSAVLLATITDSKAKISANIPDSILTREKYLRTKINGLKKLIYDERQSSGKSNTDKISEWESMIFGTQQQYQYQREYIMKNFPEYYKLRLNPETLSLEETINHLSKGQAILEYSLLEEKVIIMLITKGQQKVFISPTPEKEINRMIESIRNNLIVKDFVNFNRKQFRSYVKETHQLYQSLVEPLESEIENKSLVFIPDGKMGFIPMELLLTKNYDTDQGYMDYKSLPYLIKKYPVSYAYSSTLLHKADLKKFPSKKKVFAMAPSYENISRTPVDSLFNHRQKTTLLMPIPGAKQEVENISKIFRSDNWIGEEATESTFTEKATGYAILHLAMHTIVNDENPMYSKLVFYQEKGQESDNLLNTYELFDLNLNAEMAVLSACNTGYGKLQRGEGIMSLARGFLYAGVPNIVMTLWPIEDAATADIMKQFYENLSDGMQKDDALRKAKLDFLENTDMLTAHPHFWASFVNIGPVKPISHTQSSRSVLWWVAAALLLGLVVVIWRFRAKR